jgi:hypothetical protein
MKSHYRISTVGVLALALGGVNLAFSSGCGNDAQAGALLGAGAGAIGGAVVGHNTKGRRTAEGAAIGAGIGAVGGYIIGNESDKAKSQHYHHPNYRY